MEWRSAGRGAGAAALAGSHPAAAAAGGAALTIVLALGVVRWPFLIAGLVLGAALLVLALLRPLAVLGLMLALGPVDLSFVTGGFKSLFAGLGGLDMNGIRLIGLTISFTAVAIVDREVLRHAVGKDGRWYAAFVVFAAASLLYSPAPIDGARLLLKLTYPFLVFVTVSGVARTPADLERLTKWALVSAVAVVLVNPVYVMAGGYYVDVEGRVRVQGMGLHQNPFSFYLLIMLLVSLARYLVRGQRRYLALCGALAAWMVLTLTRITLGAAMAGLAAFALYDAIVARRSRTLFVAAAVAVAVAVPLAPVALERTFGYLPGPGELFELLRDPTRLYRSVALEGREILWPVVFKAFLSSPVIGLGLGSSTAVIAANFPAWYGGVIHNEYLRLATDTGIVGAALFAGAMLVWCGAMVRAGRSGPPLVREYALPCFAGIVAWSVISLTDNPFDYYAPFTQYIGFLCGAALAAARMKPEGGGEASDGR